MTGMVMLSAFSIYPDIKIQSPFLGRVVRYIHNVSKRKILYQLSIITQVR
jgi:hypothetical protein